MENMEVTDGGSNLRQSWTLTFIAAELTRNFIAVPVWAKASKHIESLMQNVLFFLILNYWLWFMKKHKPQEISFNFRQGLQTDVTHEKHLSESWRCFILLLFSVWSPSLQTLLIDWFPCKFTHLYWFYVFRYFVIWCNNLKSLQIMLNYISAVLFVTFKDTLTPFKENFTVSLTSSNHHILGFLTSPGSTPHLQPSWFLRLGSSVLIPSSWFLLVPSLCSPAPSLF